MSSTLNKTLSILVVTMMLCVTLGGMVGYSDDAYAESYNINFDTMGGDYISSEYQEEGSMISLPSPMRMGYTFDGWYEDSGYGMYVGGAYDSYTVPPNEVTLYAKWVPSPIEISPIDTVYMTLGMDGSFYISYTPMDLPVMFRETSGSSLTITVSSSSGTISAATPGTYDVTLEAYYDENGTTYVLGSVSFQVIVGCRVSFDPNGGSQYPSDLEGASITFPDPGTYDGFYFDGWYTDSQHGERVGNAGDTYTPTDNVRLYAHWMPAPITFDPVDTLYINQSEDYPFTLTYSPSSDIPYQYKFTTPSELYVMWQDGNNFTVNASSSGSYQFTVEAYVTYNGSEITVGSITVDVEVQAKIWVYFDSDGGSNSCESIETADGFITLPDPGTKDGYDFIGWSRSYDGETIGDVGDTYSFDDTENFTLYAVWELGLVTFDPIDTQYAIVGETTSFTVSISPDKPVEFRPYNAPSDLNVDVSGNTINVTPSDTGSFFFSIEAYVGETMVGVTDVYFEVVEKLTFVNTPEAGFIVGGA